MRDDGGVKVVNRGYDTGEGEWKEAVGKAYFVDDADVGRLKVSFFGPFYGGYTVFALGEDYDYSLVSGPNHGYLWVLGREPEIAPELLEELVGKAEAAGFDTSGLIIVEHDQRQ